MGHSHASCSKMLMLTKLHPLGLWRDLPWVQDGDHNKISCVARGTAPPSPHNWEHEVLRFGGSLPQPYDLINSVLQAGLPKSQRAQHILPRAVYFLKEWFPLIFMDMGAHEMDCFLLYYNC